MRDSSLDEYLDGEESEEGDDTAESETSTESSDAEETASDGTANEEEAAGDDTADEGTVNDEPVDEEESDAVDPAESTYDWTPTGASCAACSATVERRWRDDDGLVCADCKSW